MKKFNIITIVLFTTIASLFANDDVFKKPAIQQLVVDNAGILSKNEALALTNKVNQFSNETSTQILIYTTKDLQGYDAGDFAQRLGESWKVGQKGFDNGIVIIFKPKTIDSKGQVWISAGYGIEPLIPDATANQIIENEMIPFFKSGKIYNGINAGVDLCMALTKKEFTAQAYSKQSAKSSGGAGLFVIIFFVAFISIFGRSRNNRHYDAGRRSNLPLMAALFMMGSGSHRGSGYSDFSSGSGSFSGGGGFGGFGGGSFGGGGAGGSW